MSLFVSPADYKQRKSASIPTPTPAHAPIEGAGKFTAKKAGGPASAPARAPANTPAPTEQPGADSRSQIELAAVRVAKFVPSLIILGYTGLCNLVNSKDPVHDKDLRLLLFKIAFWICFILTPIYIAYFDRKNTKPMRWINGAIGTIAFPIWAYAFPCGLFYETAKYDPVIAGFILIVFSLFTAFVPAPKFEGN